MHKLSLHALEVIELNIYQPDNQEKQKNG